MKTTTFLLAAVASTALLAAHAEDSVCQTQVLLPALYKPQTQDIVTQEPSTDYQTVPPQLGQGERKVKIADAYVEYEIIPAKFGEVTESVEVERERVEIETLPPTYRTETQRVKIKEASQRWNPACPQVLANNGDVPSHCLITIPAEYQEITRQVVDLPARTVKKIIPARTATITRKVLLEPAKIVRKEIPAQYATVKLTKVESAAKVTTTPIPAQTQSVPVQQQTRPPRIVTQPALCEHDLNPETLKQLQARLQQQGYYDGNLDSILGEKTRAALIRFQEDHQLASGAITLETLKKLQLR